MHTDSNKPTKDLRRVEQLQESPSSLSFICSKSTVRISHAQQLQEKKDEEGEGAWIMKHFTCVQEGLWSVWIAV